MSLATTQHPLPTVLMPNSPEGAKGRLAHGAKVIGTGGCPSVTRRHPVVCWCVEPRVEPKQIRSVGSQLESRSQPASGSRSSTLGVTAAASHEGSPPLEIAGSTQMAVRKRVVDGPIVTLRPASTNCVISYHGHMTSRYLECNFSRFRVPTRAGRMSEHNSLRQQRRPKECGGHPVQPRSLALRFKPHSCHVSLIGDRHGSSDVNAADCSNGRGNSRLGSVLPSV